MPKASAANLLFCLIALVHESLPNTLNLIIFPVVIITPSEHPSCASLPRMGFCREGKRVHGSEL